MKLNLDCIRDVLLYLEGELEVDLKNKAISALHLIHMSGAKDRAKKVLTLTGFANKN